MDSQIVFNQVTDHLAQQKAPALGVAGGCVLRGVNGTKCAMGFLIPDDEYTPAMEGDANLCNNLDGKFKQWLKKSLSPTPKQYGMLKKLQICHDNADSKEDAKRMWPLHLERVAKSFDLVFNRADFEKKLEEPNKIQ